LGGGEAYAAPRFLSWVIDGLMWAMDGRDKIHDKLGSKLRALHPEFLSWVIDGQADKIFVVREPRRRAEPRAKTGKTAIFLAPARLFDKLARALFTRRSATKTHSRRALILFSALLLRPRRIAIPGFPG
jgi:hypothetical protein